MTIEPLIAIDAMGGDEGVSVMIAGAALARHRHPDFRFLLVGDKEAIDNALKKHPNLSADCEILHTSDIVSSDDKVSRDLLRRSKKTSMGSAIDAVKSGRASAAVSAGNTGALLAIANFSLRSMAGIDRPALAALLPTMKDSDVVMLDLGANTECDARNLVQFAVMGAAYSRVIYGIEKPSVKLLNIGTEEIKGKDSVREASNYLTDADSLPLSFQGYTEADKINSGDADVIVCDGYSGNIALKAVEGAARFVTDLLKRAFTSSIRSKFGFLVSRPATELLKHHLDPNNHNGAVFMGLNGVVVKSHGSANEKGVANAIEVAARLVEDKITDRIAEDMKSIDGLLPDLSADKDGADKDEMEKGA